MLRVGQISPRMSCTKEGKILCQPGWKVKQLPKVDYFAPILENSTRAQHVKAQFARQDVTAKTDSAGECFDPLLELFFRIWIYFLQSTTYIRKNHLWKLRSPGECRCRSGFSGPGCKVRRQLVHVERFFSFSGLCPAPGLCTWHLSKAVPVSLQGGLGQISHNLWQCSLPGRLERPFLFNGSLCGRLRFQPGFLHQAWWVSLQVKMFR